MNAVDKALNPLFDLDVVIPKIKFAAVREDAVIPTKRDEDAGFDVYANFDEDYIEIPPHTTVMIPSGIASAVPVGYMFELKERGSTGTKGIGQRSGVIDSGYRGEWIVPLTNHNSKTLVIAKFPEDFDENYVIVYPYTKAIAQALLREVPDLPVEVVSYDELLKISSERGCGKLGSSGK